MLLRTDKYISPFIYPQSNNSQRAVCMLVYTLRTDREEKRAEITNILRYH